MPRARGEKDYLNLARGLNTESNPLNFPEGYTTDEQNFVLAKDGDRRVRRKGVENTQPDLEATLTGTLPSITGSYYWQEQDFYIVVIASLNNDVVLRIHKNDTDFTFVGEYEISTDAGSSFIPSFSPILDGVVLVGESMNNYIKPLFLTPNADGDIEIYSTQLYFRDFELIDDNLNITERPDTLTEEHLYNLYNAGWYAARRNDTGDYVDPLSLFDSEDTVILKDAVFTATDQINLSGGLGLVTNLSVGSKFTITGSASNDGEYEVAEIDYLDLFSADIVTVEQTIVNEASVSVDVTISDGGNPSNADIPVLGTKANASGIEVFSADTLYETVVGSTEAPRGHYIYDVEETRTRDDVIASKNTDGAVPNTLTLEDTIAV